MIPLRLFDRDRQPPDWTDIIRPGQYAAFSKTIDTGASCDPDGQLFASVEDTTCLLFDGLTEARAFCEEQVGRAPAVRFEIFDSTGRTHAPLLVVVHPSRVARLEGNNLLVIAARLIQLNSSYAHAERQRLQRLAEQMDASGADGKPPQRSALL